MISTESWVKRPDGVELYSHTWAPEGEVKATCLFIHGFGEHIDRYAHVAAEFVNIGIKVGGFDQRGFGQTTKKNGDQGHCGSEELLFKDLLDFADSLKVEGTPQFVYGHSMGGAIALKFVAQYPDRFKGVISSGPLLAYGKAAALQPHEKFALKFIPAIFPKLALPKVLPAHFISRDEQVQKMYETDPLIHAYCSSRSGADMVQRIDTLMNLKTYPVPVLIAHGQADEITDPKASEQFIANIECQDKTLKLIPDAKHEIHNELPDVRAQLFPLYTSWISQRL
ncbi:Alpha/Beta hydrolase protein [Gorgonomyces haynaldii]|nr:Alpha/Beta hydrolase protein [Gorgonomyces haynaldii]